MDFYFLKNPACFVTIRTINAKDNCKYLLKIVKDALNFKKY